MTRRRVWMLVHRVNGLLLAGFLTVVGTTGALLAWKAPLERVFAPRLFILHQGWKNAVPFVYALHESLALGEWGTTLLGAAALLWTFDCFVGMYLTFPPSRRHAGYTKLQRFRAWPRRWAPAWLIRWRQGRYSGSTTCIAPAAFGPGCCC